MRQLLIEFAAGLYNIFLWGVVPLGAAAAAYYWHGELPARTVRKMGDQGFIDRDDEYRLIGRIERRGMIWAGGAFLVVGLAVAFADANMHAIVRAAHLMRD